MFLFAKLATLSVLLLSLCPITLHSGLPEPKILDEYTIDMPNKDEFKSPKLKDKYEENQFNLIFSDLPKDEEIFNAMIVLERALLTMVCGSCTPKYPKDIESIDDSLCKSVLAVIPSLDSRGMVCYQIYLHFPLQDKEAIKVLRKQLDAKIKEFLAQKKIEAEYSCDYSRRKDKIKDTKK